MRDAIQVLHVDDEPEFADLTATYLERENDRLAVETTTSSADGLDQLSDGIDCVVADYDMPGLNGIEFLESVREEYPDLPFILFTGKGSEEIASDAISAGVTDYLQKESGPDQYAVLANRVTNAVAQSWAEHQLQEERQRFQILFERLTQPTVEVEYQEDEPIVQQVNPAFEDVFGYDASELVGSSLDDYILSEGQEGEASQINQRVQAGGGLDSLEVTRRTADGNREFLLQNAVYDDGSGGFAIYTDITDRKEREQQLERQNGRLTAIFENFPEPTLAYTYENGEPQIRQVNEAFTETFGYEAEEAVGAEVDSLLVPPGRQTEAARIDDRVRTGDSVDEILQRQTKEGIREFRFRNILLPDDEVFDGYGIYADVTDRKERIRELERQNERLEEFASIVSHDLRNPLNVAMARLELARDTCDSPHLVDIADAHDRMEWLIDDLLTLARQGETVREMNEVSLGTLVEDCWAGVETAGTTLDVETDATIRADRGRLQQAIENLVRNAVEHGGSDVTVRVGALADRAGFYVADDGQGIPEDTDDSVFESGYSTADDGTGLGLAIVREIVEAHGWEIGVSDSESGGARFEITGVGLVD